MKILLVHGLSRTPFSLFSLERRLKQAGWKTEQFGYAAFLESYSRIVERLQDRLEEISTNQPYGIVAHSLGGLLTRSALGEGKLKLPKHVVMLGTPNRPPRLASLAWKLAPFRWFTGQCGFNLASPQFFNQLPTLLSSYTIIAGTQGLRASWSPFGFELNDGIVALNETRIFESDRPIELPVNHTFMMNDPIVQETVIESLKSGNK